MISSKNIILFDHYDKIYDILLKYRGCYWWRYSPVFIRGIRSVIRFVLGNHMLQLGRRQTRLSCIGGCSEGKGVLFEEALTDKYFQVLPEVFAVDGLVSLTVMVRAVFFRFVECWVILDWLWAPDPRLVLDGIEDLIDREPEKNEVLCQLENLDWTR